ncbi:hypothetical protein [Ornithinimicrobium kibberense]|uniref:Lipoprotein n=1 Tax=Ornithinimicrobium kibberense TaxID=282060 RepID=A0ABV5V1S2_9MICO|nr:hypothetical protein [Ornithinimicrobium kibberense]
MPSRARRVRPGGWPCALAAAATALLGGCAPPGDGIGEVESVERRTWGGMCAEGPCGSLLVVTGDQWEFTDQTGEWSGVLSRRRVAALESATATTRLAELTEPARRCEADVDGTSVRYAWVQDGRRTEVSSCDVRIPASDPLVVVLDRLAEDVRTRSAGPSP